MAATRLLFLSLDLFELLLFKVIVFDRLAITAAVIISD